MAISSLKSDPRLVYLILLLVIAAPILAHSVISTPINPMTKTLLMFGKMDDLASGVYGKTVRYDTKILGEDKHVFTIYDCHAGVDYKVMEITYTRAK